MRAARKTAKLVNGRQHLQVGCGQAGLLHPAQQPVSCNIAMCRSGMHNLCLHVSTRPTIVMDSPQYTSLCRWAAKIQGRRDLMSDSAGIS